MPAEMSGLPETVLEELWRGTGSRQTVSAAVIGDMISGIWLALWDSLGHLHSVQLSSHSAAPQQVCSS